MTNFKNEKQHRLFFFSQYNTEHPAAPSWLWGFFSEAANTGLERSDCRQQKKTEVRGLRVRGAKKKVTPRSNFLRSIKTKRHSCWHYFQLCLCTLTVHIFAPQSGQKESSKAVLYVSICMSSFTSWTLNPRWLLYLATTAALHLLELPPRTWKLEWHASSGLCLSCIAVMFKPKR